MTCAGISSLIISRLAAVPGPGVPPGRRDPRTAARGRSTANLQRGIDWLASHFQVGENFGARPAVEVSTTSTAWSAPAGWPASGSSARTTGIAMGAEELVHDQDQLDGLLARGQLEENELDRDQLRAAVPGQGPRAGADQQAPPRPGQRLEQRPRRRPQPRRRGLARLEEPADLAGRRPQQRHGRRTCSRPRSSTSTATTRPSSPAAAQAEHPRLRRAGRLPVRRRLLRRARSSTRASGG